MSENATTNETYYREKQVLAQFAPVHRTTWWRWVKAGMAPAPVKIGARVVAWRKSDLEHWQRTRAPTLLHSRAATENPPNPA